MKKTILHRIALVSLTLMTIASCSKTASTGGPAAAGSITIAIDNDAEVSFASATCRPLSGTFYNIAAYNPTGGSIGIAAESIQVGTYNITGSAANTLITGSVITGITTGNYVSKVISSGKTGTLTITKNDGKLVSGSYTVTGDIVTTTGVAGTPTKTAGTAKGTFTDIAITI
jgi:hypothetical protein